MTALGHVQDDRVKAVSQQVGALQLTGLDGFVREHA